MSQASQFGPGMPLYGKFWQTFWPAVTANVGFWAVSLAGPFSRKLLCKHSHLSLKVSVCANQVWQPTGVHQNV